jgi:hypothetical protein
MSQRLTGGASVCEADGQSHHFDLPCSGSAAARHRRRIGADAPPAAHAAPVYRSNGRPRKLRTRHNMRADIFPEQEPSNSARCAASLEASQKAHRLRQWTQDLRLSRRCVLEHSEGNRARPRCDGVTNGYRDRQVAPRGELVRRDPPVRA